MNRNGCIKAMSLFSRTCGSSKLNPRLLSFDGHGSHFNDRSKNLLRSHHISPFILKAGDSTNDQPNDNGANLKLKRYYGISKVKWKRQNVTMKFTAAHMNSVLVETWHSFQQESASVIIYAFKKTKLLTLAPPYHDNNAQGCLAATQTPSVIKSK